MSRILDGNVTNLQGVDGQDGDIECHGFVMVMSWVCESRICKEKPSLRRRGKGILGLDLCGGFRVRGKGF